ncbi:MAG: hypothetical protein ACP5GX_10430, partial [Anaerolineae bacterium]
MSKRWTHLSWAIGLALLAGVVLFMTVLAVEKTPPYVIAVQDTGFNSRPNRTGVDPGRYGYVLDDLGKIWILDGAQITSSLEVGNAFDIGVDPGRYVYLTSMTQGNPLTVLQGKEKIGTVTLNGPSGAVDVLTTT